MHPPWCDLAMGTDLASMQDVIPGMHLRTDAASNQLANVPDVAVSAHILDVCSRLAAVGQLIRIYI